MTLAERIQEQRKRCRMSQEKLAELMGVSRQAVTKWESGQSAPNTENLFRLAEIFGVTVDFMLDADSNRGSSPAEQVYYLYKLEEEKKAVQRLAQRKQTLKRALLLAVGWFLIFVAGAFSGDWLSNEYSLLGIVFQSYPFGWLVQNNLFWLSAALCLLPVLWGRWKFCTVGTGGFALALLLGTLLGENPAGAAYGHGHYGWFIWGSVFLFSLAMGLVLERLEGPWSKKHWIWTAVYAVGVIGCTALIVLTMPQNFG
ncbi:MAG: helix-turn-helix domain-containing protein [Oscillospiraceae bacterium]|nr:helix-turn-helix domain-containing protein [Oscillospiraceae bacterium]